jgi:hypothetical protein
MWSGPKADQAVTIGPDDDVEQRRKDIIEAVKRVDSGERRRHPPDMFGGTPQARDFGDGPTKGGGHRRDRPSDAGQARQVRTAARWRSGGGGARPQIHHHRQRV